ncbi:MAG: TonB-dependent receptor [Pseudomonadota bacterium]
MTSSNAIRLAVRKAIYAGAAVTAAASLTPVAYAQSEGADAVEEIVVTGSRIAKKDFTSNAPVATVDSEQIQLTNTINTESLLNTLPQAVPGLDRTSNNPGNGTATVDLRGLGSNRTLVLINGRRVVPTTSGGSVDINSIPNALIENIEVLTGGASAVYGSDAVAGVVNFILKDDFEGVAVTGGYEITQEGDAGIYSADITLGANLADDRGNVTFNLSYTDREDLFQGDRDFSFFAQFDDTDANGNPILIDGGSSGVPGTSIFAGGLGTFSPDSFGIIFEPNGAVRPFETGAAPNDFYNYAPVNYIQLPQTRYQASALGHFDISEKATVFGSAMFTSSKVPQQLAPTPIFQTTTFTLDGSPFIDAAGQQVLSDALGDGVDTDGDGIDDTATAFVRRRMEEIGPRVSDDTFTSFQVQGGLRGDINESWSYEGYLQFGNVNIAATQLGNINRDRFDQALRLFGEDGSTSDPTGTIAASSTACNDPNANGGTVGCSPLNIFGEGNISAAAGSFVQTAVASTADFDQLIVAANVAGDLGDALALPGGNIGLAFGVEQIENDFNFRPSQDLAASTIAGFNGAPAVAGGFDSTGYYVEAYLPILAGADFADLLDLELAYRSTDFSTAGTVDAYKIAGSWAPTDKVRFRAGFNTANRAPSIGELFLPQSEGFPSAQDPCSGNGATQTPEVAAICQATGVPAGVIFSPAINLPASQVRQVSGGNPDLIEESAETFTAGVVFTEVLEGLSFSIDYFDIEIEDFISSFGGGAANVLNTCYDPADPNGGVGSPFCNVIDRRADGTIRAVNITTQNVAVQTLNGFDLLGSYDTELFGGDLRINYVGTFTEENDFVAFAGDDPIECAGKFGNLCGEPIPEYKHRMAFNWTKDDVTAQFVWRYVGETDDDDDANLYAVETLDAESYLDAAVSYSLTENYSFTFGIDNVFDTDPPIIGDNQEQANTFPATYDVFGRTFFLRATAQF